MAIVIQQIDATPDYVPYERPPQPATLWSPIPRGLQSFIVDAQQIDVKPVNDDFILEILATLPPNFGYVMAAMNFTLAQDRATDWFNICNLNLQNFYRAAPTLSLGLSGNWPFALVQSSLNNVTRTIQENNNLPSFPMIGSSGSSGILVNFSAWNGNNTVTLTGIANFFISFWQFDLEQIRKFPINSPIPTHSR